MNPLKKFLNQNSYKFPKGYPDINDANDVVLLISLLEQYGISLNLLNEIENKDNSLFGKTIFETFQGKIPSVSTEYKFTGGNISIKPEDESAFFKLYNIIPAQNVGKGEVALYWLFNYNNPSNPNIRLKKQDDVNAADFKIDGKSIEVKSYKSLDSKITLGKFKEDTQSRDLINNIFGITNLNNLVGNNKAKLISEINFNAENLKSSFTQLLELNTMFSENKDIVDGFPLLNQVHTLLLQIFESSSDPEQLAKNVLISLASTKLSKKPGFGNYIANINPNSLDIEIVEIPKNTQEILQKKSFEEINNSISVTSAEIQFKFNIFK